MKKKLLIITFIVITILLVSLISYLAAKHINDNSEVNNQDEAIKNGSSLNNYSGEFISAILPNHWSITEYSDNTGMKSTTDSIQYSNLTGFDIKKNETVIFSFKGIDGVGSNGFCNEIYKFADTSSQFINDLVTPSEINPITPPIIDLSNTSYESLSIFGRETRRIGNKLYFKRVDSEINKFNPECGLGSQYVEFTEPYFIATSEGNNSSPESIYEPLIQGNPTSDELLDLDKILISMHWGGNQTNDLTILKRDGYQFEYSDKWKVSDYGTGLMPIEYCVNEICPTEILSFTFKVLSTSDEKDLQKILDSSFGLRAIKEESYEKNGMKFLYAEYQNGSINELTWTILNDQDHLLQVSFRQQDGSRGTLIDYSKYTEEAKQIVESIKFID